MDFLNKKKKNDYSDDFGNMNNFNSNMIRIDLADDEDFYYLYADVPGRESSDIKIKFKGNFLSLRIIEEAEENNLLINKSCIIQERLHDEAERLIDFEEPIDKKNVIAKLENGLLKVTIKKINPSDEDESDLIKIT